MSVTKRLFIGFMISDEVGRQLIIEAKQQQAFLTGGIRWTIDGNFHVTSHFLGDINETDIPQVTTALQSVVAGKPAPTITIDKISPFPQYGSRLLAAYLKTNRIINSIFNELMPHFNALKVRSDNHSYTPHITLARGLDKGVSSDKILNNFVIKINQLALYESLLSPTGSNYLPISIANLD